MTPAHTYTARCWREGSAWVVDVPELDETVRAARLSQVEAVARDLVARCGGEGATAAEVLIDLRVHEELRQLLDAASLARQEGDPASAEAVTLHRGLARRLAAEGFPAE